jgi:phosphate uptake regulator
MEVRRLQMTGGSSYIITLPKEWVVALKLKKNDPLGIMAQPDGTLLISPRVTEESPRKEMTFHIDKNYNESRLFRSLVAAYMSGYSAINISSKETLPPYVRSVVRKFVSMAIGQEVVEEKENFVLIKDLLNPTEMAFDKTVRRMYVVVRQMCADALFALKNGDLALARDVIGRDNDADRLGWLVARQYRLLLSNPGLAKKMGITVEESSAYFLTTRMIERIGDHAVKIARGAISVTEEKANPKLSKSVSLAGELALHILQGAAESFLSKDANKANRTIDEVPKLEALCDDIDKLALSKKGVVALATGNVAESIRRIGEYSRDISEKAIDYGIRTEEEAAH